MNRTLANTFMFLCCLSLTACMYPSDQRQQLSKVDIQVAKVQAQSEQYLAQNKVVPYKYSVEQRKFTTHYLVDFSQLTDVPLTAYEKGGSFIYVFVGAEGKQPLVRLFDLRVNDEVEKVQLALKDFKTRTGKLPTNGKEIGGYYNIDLVKLHMTDVSIPSPYFASSHLPMLIDKNGLIYLDYRSDVTRLIQTTKQKPVTGDLRQFIIKDSLFVPAFSPPMKVGENGEILFSS
jgi:hypothetical protein